MLAHPYEALSTAQDRLDWSVGELFRSPIVRVSSLRCRPHALGQSCEKCTVDNQLVFVTRGGFVRHLGRVTQVANAGKAMFFRAGMPYRTSHLDPSGDSCIVFSFRDEAVLAGRSGSGFNGACDAIAPQQFANALRIAAAIRNRAMTTLEVEEWALALLAETATSRRDDAGATATRAWVCEVEALLTASPGTDWSLALLASRLGKSPFHITRQFRAATGLPLHQYLRNLRITAALALIADGVTGIAALALDLGFYSHSHFSTSFRQALGYSPSAFRHLTHVARRSALPRSASTTH